MSPTLRTLGVAIITMIVTGCLGPADDAAPLAPPIIPPVPPNSEPVGRLEVTFDTREAFTDLVLRMHIGAYNIHGTRIDSDKAVVTSWNPSVATVEGVQPIEVRQPNGVRVTEAFAFISMRVAGNALITVKLGDVIDSTVLHVKPLPYVMNVLAVDSFTVVEYYACANCNILTYAPLLKLREPTGTSGADVIAVQFTVPGMTTGFCIADRNLHFAPGYSAHVNYIDPEYYNNDMIFAIANGRPLPDGPASARVVVRDTGGNYGLIEATAPIQRMVSFPAFPPASFAGVYWSCNGRWP